MQRSNDHAQTDISRAATPRTAHEVKRIDQELPCSKGNSSVYVALFGLLAINLLLFLNHHLTLTAKRQLLAING